MEDITDWTFDETADLFANLHNIVETNQPTRLSPMLSGDVFWNRLQESLENARPLDQIMDKLHEHLEGNFNKVYTRGISCMRLDADMKWAVESKLVAIRLSTPRKLRSNSRKRLRPDRVSVTPASSSPAKSVGPSARRLTRLRGDATDKLAASQDSQRIRSRLTSELPNTSTANTEDELEVHQSIETCSEVRSDSSCNLNPVPSLQASPESFINANIPKRLQIIDYGTPGPIQTTCEQDVQDCSYETLQDVLNDNMTLREKLAKLTKANDSLDQQVRVLHSKLRVQNGELGSQPVDPLDALCDRIVDLESRLNHRKEFLDPFLKRETENDHTSSMWKRMKQIESSIYNMSRIIESLPSRKEFQYPQTDHLKQESSKDLGELLGRVFADVQESALLPHLRSKVSVGDLVQAIVGAAVCEWVFESELRCTAMMKTALLEAFRYLMGTIPGGEAAFQSLNFAAHQLVVSDEHFKTVSIPQTATKLAGRLVGAIGPFIKTKRGIQSTIPIKRDLESIFQHALEVKAQVIVGKYTFGTIWPSRGSAYEESLMRTQWAESVPDYGKTRNYELLKVKLPLIPGLRFYSHEKTSVDYCSFAKGDVSVLGKSELFCEAVVAVEI